MVYDLSMSDRYDWQYPLPGHPKPRVMGINLLRSCKQIRQETHDRVWCEGWTFEFPSDTSSADLRFATSSLHELALAKIRVLCLQIKIDPDTLTSWGPIDLEVLSSFKSLYGLSVSVHLGTPDKRTKLVQSDLSKSVYLKGLVIQILLQVPQQVWILQWDLIFRDSRGFHFSGALTSIAKEHKHLQGSDYLPKVRNPYDLSSSPPVSQTIHYASLC